MSINRTQNTFRSHLLYLRNTQFIWDHKTETYEMETSTLWDRGRDQDQLLWDWDQKSGLNTLTSLTATSSTEEYLQEKCRRWTEVSFWNIA